MGCEPWAPSPEWQRLPRLFNVDGHFDVFEKTPRNGRKRGAAVPATVPMPFRLVPALLFSKRPENSPNLRKALSAFNIVATPLTVLPDL